MNEVFITGKTQSFNGVRLLSGSNDVDDKALEELKNNKWFAHLIKHGMISINGKTEEQETKETVLDKSMIRIKRKRVTRKS